MKIENKTLRYFEEKDNQRFRQCIAFLRTEEDSQTLAYDCVSDMKTGVVEVHVDDSILEGDSFSDDGYNGVYPNLKTANRYWQIKKISWNRLPAAEKRRLHATN